MFNGYYYCYHPSAEQLLHLQFCGSGSHLSPHGNVFYHNPDEETHYLPSSLVLMEVTQDLRCAARIHMATLALWQVTHYSIYVYTDVASTIVSKPPLTILMAAAAN